jgi:hypothetical protein
MKLTKKGQRWLNNIITVLIVIGAIALITHLPKDTPYIDSSMVQAECPTWADYIYSIGGNPYAE